MGNKKDSTMEVQQLHESNSTALLIISAELVITLLIIERYWYHTNSQLSIHTNVRLLSK